MISATALQLHPECTLILDETAGRLLKEADYYHWVFENQPEWEPFRGASSSPVTNGSQAKHSLKTKTVDAMSDVLK